MIFFIPISEKYNSLTNSSEKIKKYTFVSLIKNYSQKHISFYLM